MLDYSWDQSIVQWVISQSPFQIRFDNCDEEGWFAALDAGTFEIHYERLYRDAHERLRNGDMDPRSLATFSCFQPIENIH